MNLNRLRSTITFFLLWIMSMIFTIYVFLNVYEQLTERDISYIPNVTKFDSGQAIIDYQACVGTVIPDAYYRFDDQLRYLEIPKINSRVEVAPLIFNNMDYFTRGNKSHLINNPASNELIIYSQNSWRTMNIHQDSLAIGDLVFLSTSSGKKYIFKINDISSEIKCLENTQIKPAEPTMKFVTDIDGEMIVINSVFINSV